MSIRRVRLPFEKQFVQIPNEWMRDQRLSRRARGLLAEIMTHSAGWDITLESLVEKGPEGRDALRAAIKELEETGYLRREQQKANGRFGAMDYVLQDPRISGVGKSDDGKTDIGRSDAKKTILQEENLEEHQASPDDAFREFFNAYPKQNNEAKTQKAWRQAVHIQGVSAEILLGCAKRYAQNCKGKQFRFIADPANWLLQGRWRDWELVETEDDWGNRRMVTRGELIAPGVMA